jgi:hypothetical protein
MDGNGRTRFKFLDNAVAIYHVVYANEGFEESAQNLFKLIRTAQSKVPGRNRLLYLDIEGHRDGEGRFDSEMVELQKEFLLGFLKQFLSEIHSPLINLKNTTPQSNDIPERLIIQTKQG